MNKKILEILEFDKVKSQFENYIVTAQGQKELDELAPLTNQVKIQILFDELTDYQRFISENEHINLSRTKDLTEILRRLDLEAQLSGKEFLEIKKVVHLGRKIQKTFTQLENVEISALMNLIDKFDELSLAAEALKIVDNTGALYDEASSELSSIRLSIKKYNSEIKRIMQELLSKNGENLSESIITIREERQVLAVKAERKNKVVGVVHDMSASGQTLYIEPNAVVSLHNELNQKKIEEKNEIVRILDELSQKLKPFVSNIEQNAWLIGHYDMIQAKHHYMLNHESSIPSLNPQKSIIFYDACHPLIEKKKVVSNDIKFDETLNTIVITGPNTGGKTITMKTLGLLTVMGQSGLPICASKNSHLHVFDDIFADIGDEQSIEQSLSTFSSHMTNIINIIDKATDNSLVLIDELGAGTDPKEGAALAIAILEKLQAKQVKTMASTHYPELKAYGMETPQVLNASMAFDIEKMRPTYRLQLGVPGRSNALEISQRLGLQEDVVAQAKELIGHEKQNINQMIANLESKAKDADERSKNIRKLEKENIDLHDSLTKAYNQITRERERTLERAQEEARVLTKEASQKASQILKDLHERSQLKPHEIIAAKGQLEDLVPNVDVSKNKALKQAKAKRGLKQGAEIIITAYGQRGKLIRIEKDGRWLVQMGSVTSKLTEDEFELTEEEKAKKQPKAKVIKRPAANKVKAQLDLRGMRYEEAELELESYIDQALLANLLQITIIHGIGTGVIREMVQKKLQRHSHIKFYEYAPINAGGSGSTIATLK